MDSRKATHNTWHLLKTTRTPGSFLLRIKKNTIIMRLAVNKLTIIDNKHNLEQKMLTYIHKTNTSNNNCNQMKISTLLFKIILQVTLNNNLQPNKQTLLNKVLGKIKPHNLNIIRWSSG